MADSKRDVAVSPADSGRPAAPSPLPRILIVDDNPEMTEYLVTLLTDRGYQPHVCHRGDKALDYVKNNVVDLVLLDVVLPDGRGTDVARSMKAAFGTERFVPIIVVSVLSDEEDKLEALNCADDYVVKPFSAAELMARILSWLRVRRLQQELFKSRRRYRNLYDNVPYMYVSVDRNCTILDCNAVFCKTIGVECQVVVGHSLCQYISRREHSSLKRLISSLGEDSTSGREEAFHLTSAPPGKTPSTVGLSAVDMGEQDSGPMIVVTMRDISDTMRLEEEQRRSRKQLYRSAKLASIGTLASGVAHEMNNPLTAILGFSGALLDRVKKGESVAAEELREYLGVINSETIRCRDIVENLSKFAREREPVISDISLPGSVDAALKLMLPRARKKNISIENTLAHDIKVRADGNKLGEAIINILSNSLDFAQPGAKVVLSAGPAPAKPDYVELKVQDTGPGIPEEILPEIFDPFFSTKEVGLGPGLGLAICHNIMEECEGRIDIVSEAGRGTTVVLEIPRARKS